MLSISYWLDLPQETRSNIAKAMGISKSGGAVVENGRVMCDGFTQDDLDKITLGKLQTYLGSTDMNFYDLFERAIDKANGKEVSTIGVMPAEEAKEAMEEWKANATDEQVTKLEEALKPIKKVKKVKKTTKK